MTGHTVTVSSEDYGWRASCECGWVGRRRDAERARNDATAHRELALMRGMLRHEVVADRLPPGWVEQEGSS